MFTSAPILGVGRPTLELLGTTHRYPEPGEQAELLQFSIQGSGSVATALIALLEWGRPCRFLGKVSDDPFGGLIRDGLSLEGCDVDSLQVEPGRISPFAFVAMPEAARLQRTVFHTPGNLSPLEARAVDARRVQGCAAVLVDGSEPSAQLAAAQMAREMGIPVVFDASRYRESLDGLVDTTDVLIASERFSAELAPRAELADRMASIQARGPGTVIVTLGEEGAIGIRDGSVVQQPIYDWIPSRERGGAGHVFFAGVVHGLLEGWSMDRLLQFASAAAGLACREIGSRGGIASLEEVTRTAWPHT